MTDPNMNAERQHLGLKAGVHGLVAGASYRVLREIRDHYGNVFPVGMELLFVRRHFLPYHGGHTVVFQPQAMYLQEEEHADVLARLEAYLEALPAGGSTPPALT